MDMPMSTSVMAMAAETATGTMSMPSSTGTGMSMAGMEGMGGSCKISMIWNWYTVDACFISSTWKISSPNMFAGSCIGVILLTMSLSALRNLHRRYDAHLRRRLQRVQPVRARPVRAGSGSGDSGQMSPGHAAHAGGAKDTFRARARIAPLLTDLPAGMRSRSRGKRASLLEQLARALLHTAEFAVAYFVMLLAMYFNGYIIICILIGAFLGYFLFDRNVFESFEDDATEVTGCCG